ncbi:hypothetical protein [Cupriavidus basilensis]
MTYCDYFLRANTAEELLVVGEQYAEPEASFDYIGQIPATYDADGVPLTLQPGYFANLRMARPLNPGELSEYTLAPPETPYRVWAE